MKIIVAKHFRKPLTIFMCQYMHYANNSLSLYVNDKLNVPIIRTLQ